MSDKNDFQEFSEDAAVKFIRERLSEDVASRLSDDDILDIVDAAYDTMTTTACSICQTSTQT